MSVRPVHYDVTLAPDLREYTFSGDEAIDIEIREPVSAITLHAAELVVESADVFRGDVLITADEIVYDAEEETVTLRFPEMLFRGRATLLVSFRGTLNDQMCGFYRSTYDVNGETRVMATTQFEATDARRAFPCWDEPAKKAAFDVTLVVPEDRTALSNMPIIAERKIGEGMKAVRFSTTPVMSTYLLAFVVSEFESLETVMPGGTLVRVFTTPGKREQGRFALDVAAKVLEFYNAYFDIPYPLPKLDLVAIPDFAAGAMENWGLITYREITLLIDPMNSGAAAMQRVAIIVSHEIAHQWFGNLVTMAWWTDLWLNEGFATWMEYFAVDHLFPEWDIWTQFAASSSARAMADDGLRNTHPIEVEVKHPREISEIFDAISYEKGAAVIRMIESYIGSDAFRDGLRLYLNRHEYANARTVDLWQALGEVSGKSVSAIMENWTGQPGFPVMTVEAFGGTRYRLRQSRFLASGETLTADEAAQVWKIPVSFGFGQAHEPAASFVFDKAEGMVWLSLGPDDRVKLNPGQVAFLRVSYPSEMLERLKPAIAGRALPAIDRFGIVSDLSALARAGALRTTQVLSVLESYREETDYTVWTAILGALGALDRLVLDRPVYPDFERYARKLLGWVTRYVGWDAEPDEPHTRKLLRAAVLQASGHYGDEGTLEEAGVRFRKFIEEPASLDPNLRYAVYTLAARQGDEVMFDQFVELYRNSTLQEERVRFLRALGFFRDEGLLSRTLNFAFSDDARAQDAFYPFAAVAANPVGRDLAWEYLQFHWDEISRRYASGGLNLLSHFVQDGTSHLASDADALDVEAFFREHQAPGAERMIRQSLERIRTTARWRDRDHAVVTEWLRAWASDRTEPSVLEP